MQARKGKAKILHTFAVSISSPVAGSEFRLEIGRAPDTAVCRIVTGYLGGPLQRCTADRKKLMEKDCRFFLLPKGDNKDADQ